MTIQFIFVQLLTCVRPSAQLQQSNVGVLKMKNIVGCCDGTWNSIDQVKDGIPIPTNVARIFHLVKSDESQVKFYDEGVGSGGLIDKIAGGVFGKGLNENIKAGYLGICEKFEKGDSIYLFGFSRGAYTVRCLAGMICKVGILDISGVTDSVILEQVDALFEKGYRNKQSLDSFAHGFKFHDLDPDATIWLR